MEMNSNIKGNDSDSQSIDEEVRGRFVLLGNSFPFVQLQNSLGLMLINPNMMSFRNEKVHTKEKTIAS